MSQCPVCGLPCKPKKQRSLIQRLTGRGKLSKHITPSVFFTPIKNPQFKTDIERASISSTIRRIPSITPILQTTPLVPPSIINLDISLTGDTHNIDAQKGGECHVQIKVCANYTSPPSPSGRGSKGFDGVILFDTSLFKERKLKLGRDAAGVIVGSTSSNDRLGLVSFGASDDDACTISELIMCTTPYKQALQHSLSEIQSTAATASTTLATTTESGISFRKGMKLAINLLTKDSRYGGHIFIISDGTFPINKNTNFWSLNSSSSSTTIHTIGIGALINSTTLRNLRHRNGSFLEFRSSSITTDSIRLTQLIGYVGTQTHLHSIEAVRCRLEFPEQVDALEIFNQPNLSHESKSQLSLTLSSLPPTHISSFNFLPQFIANTWWDRLPPPIGDDNILRTN